MRAPVALIALLMATPVLAQGRTAAQERLLINLAYVIGESHALAQICRNPSDQYWRERMITLIETERPAPSLQQRLQTGFNDGYADMQRAFPTCTPAAQRVDADVAVQGQDLARRLAAETD